MEAQKISLSHLQTALVVTLFGVRAFWMPSGALAASVPLIVHPVDENQRVVLSGNAPIHITPEVDRGAVDDSFPLNAMQLQLRRSPEREQAAETLADDLERGGSGKFHHWLTAGQYAEQFGVAPEDIATISTWLSSHGFTVLPPSPSRMTIDFSGTAGQVREAFGTEIHALEVRGERHIANLRDPSIPAALAPAIEGIVSLNDFVHAPRSSTGLSTLFHSMAMRFTRLFRQISRPSITSIRSLPRESPGRVKPLQSSKIATSSIQRTGRRFETPSDSTPIVEHHLPPSILEHARIQVPLLTTWKPS